MTTPGSLLAPKATPFPLRETAIQNICTHSVHSADNNEYSFLVDLDILSLLVRSVFSVGQLQERYGSFRQFVAVWPWEIKIKCIENDGEFS